MRRLFWDIETSPDVVYSWRVGRKITLNHDALLQERAIICICYKWERNKRVYSLQWDKGCDRQMLVSFAEIAQEADELVGHNGDKFDLRFFQGRNLIHGLAPLPEFKTVDTLAIARRRFMLNCNRLDYLGKILGVGGKRKTDFQMWKSIVEDNCPTAMAKMVRYCKRDVAMLEQVYQRMAPYHRPKSHAGVVEGRDRWTCPGCGSEVIHTKKHIVSAAGIKSHNMYCNSCGRYFTVNDKVYRDYLEQK